MLSHVEVFSRGCVQNTSIEHVLRKLQCLSNADLRRFVFCYQEEDLKVKGSRQALIKRDETRSQVSDITLHSEVFNSNVFDKDEYDFQNEVIFYQQYQGNYRSRLVSTCVGGIDAILKMYWGSLGQRNVQGIRVELLDNILVTLAVPRDFSEEMIFVEISGFVNPTNDILSAKINDLKSVLTEVEWS